MNIHIVSCHPLTDTSVWFYPFALLNGAAMTFLYFMYLHSLTELVPPLTPLLDKCIATQWNLGGQGHYVPDDHCVPRVFVKCSTCLMRKRLWYFPPRNAKQGIAIDPHSLTHITRPLEESPWVISPFPTVIRGPGLGAGTSVARQPWSHPQGSLAQGSQTYNNDELRLQ